MVHHFPMIARAQDGGSGVRPSVRGVDRPPLSRAELEVRIHLPPARSLLRTSLRGAFHRRTEGRNPSRSKLLRQRTRRWHLDEMVVLIARKRMHLSRAVDHEGEILDISAHYHSLIADSLYEEA